MTLESYCLEEGFSAEEALELGHEHLSRLLVMVIEAVGREPTSERDREIVYERIHRKFLPKSNAEWEYALQFTLVSIAAKAAARAYENAKQTKSSRKIKQLFKEFLRLEGLRKLYADLFFFKYHKVI